jgi:hypothetical protein
MLLTVPVYQSTANLLETFVAVMRQKGGLRNHRMLFVAAPSCLAAAQQFAPSLRQVCPEVDVVKSDREPNGSPNWAMNMMFQDMDAALRMRKNNDRTFYCDLTCTPLSGDFWDKFEAEWVRNSRLFNGVVLEVPGKTDRYMMICGGFPGNLERSHGSTYAMMRVANKGSFASPGMAGGNQVPRIDITMGGAIAGQAGANNTALIQYQPDTKGYQKDDERVFGVDAKGQHQYVSDDKLLHVGCIDGSLAKLLLEGCEVVKPQEAAEHSGQWPAPATGFSLSKEQEDRFFQRFDELLVKRLSALTQFTSTPISPSGVMVSSIADNAFSPTDKEHAEVMFLGKEDSQEIPEPSEPPPPYELPAAIQGRATLEKIHKLVDAKKEISVADVLSTLQGQGESITPPMIKAFVKQTGSGLILDSGLITRAA